MNNQTIGLLAMLALILTASILGFCMAQKKEGWAVFCGLLVAALAGTTGYYFTMPSSINAAKYLQRGESIMAVATFSEYNSEGRYVDKVVAKIAESYLVLELPPLKDFDSAEKAYRVNHTWNQQSGLLKVESIPSEVGPLTMVSFEPKKEDTQSRWRNTGKN